MRESGRQHRNGTILPGRRLDGGPSPVLSSVAAVTLLLVGLGLVARVLEARMRPPRPDDARPLTSLVVDAAVTGLSWSSAVRSLAIADAGGRVALWEPASGLRYPLPRAGAEVSAVAWGPDGRHLAVARRDGSLDLWEPDGAGQPALLHAHGGAVLALAWSPDGRRLASGGADRTVQIWSVATGARANAPLTEPNAAVTALAWSPDGELLAAAHGEQVTIWATADWRPVQLLHLPVAAGCLAWSPDSERLATGLADGAIQLWSAGTWAAERKLTGHSRAITAVAWAQDGRLASASRDGTIRLWPKAPGSAPEVINGSQTPVLALAWSPDGDLLASGLANGVVRTWRTDGADA